MNSAHFNPDKILSHSECNKTSKELVKKVVDFIWKFDKAVIQDFYIGVTNVPDKRLFDEHKVRRDSQRFLVLEAAVNIVAVEAEKELLNLDMNGSLTNSEGKYLYCYYIDGFTKEYPKSKI